MVTHKEALAEAMTTLLTTVDSAEPQLEAAIRAYLDARGLVMVPKEPTDGMINAVHRGLAVSRGHAEAIAEAVISSAPDQFKDDAL